jgi:hypothetical protein
LTTSLDTINFQRNRAANTIKVPEEEATGVPVAVAAVGITIWFAGMTLFERGAVAFGGGMDGATVGGYFNL